MEWLAIDCMGMVGVVMAGKKSATERVCASRERDSDRDTERERRKESVCTSRERDRKIERKREVERERERLGRVEQLWCSLVRRDNRQSPIKSGPSGPTITLF